MGTDTWTYHSTYRGIVIQVYTRSATGITDYTAYTDRWVMSTSLSAVKSKIDDYLGPEEPEPDPWETVYHSTYRGFEIRQYTLGKKYTFTTDTVWVKDTISQCHATIDAYLYVEPEPKKPTTLSIDVSPTSGAPPYTVTIIAVLTSSGTRLQGKRIKLYKNGSYKTSKYTDYEGRVQFTDTVTAESSYYVSFAGDSVYEGCDAGDDTGVTIGVGLGGVGLLVLLYLILKGGK